MGVHGQQKTVCTDSWLWEENPLPHQGIVPVSVAWWSDALTNWATFYPKMKLKCWSYCRFDIFATNRPGTALESTIISSHTKTLWQVCRKPIRAKPWVSWIRQQTPGNLVFNNIGQAILVLTNYSQAVFVLTNYWQDVFNKLLLSFQTFF